MAFAMAHLEGTGQKRRCPKCAAVVADTGKPILRCPECGFRDGYSNFPPVGNGPHKNGDPKQTAPRSRKDPGVAALLSAFFPGGGQLYTENIPLGVLFLLLVPATSVLGFLIHPAWFFATLLIWAANLADAFSGAKEFNKGVQPVPAPERSASDVAAKLERLVQLRERGHLSQKEFLAAKKKLLQD